MPARQGRFGSLALEPSPPYTLAVFGVQGRVPVHRWFASLSCKESPINNPSSRELPLSSAAFVLYESVASVARMLK